MEGKHLMANGYMQDKVLNRIKAVKGIEDFGNSKILFNTHDNCQDDITLKNVETLATCVIKDDGRFYSQLFLEEALFLKKTW